MTRYLIDETPPEQPLASEVVLHVRRHLRSAIRKRAESAPRDLALLFGFPHAFGHEYPWRRAASSEQPLQEGAALAAGLRGLTGSVVPLGRDADHLEECRRWLLARKEQDDAFEKLVATDLATLLELSRARDLALARGIDDEGRARYLHVLIQGETGTGKEVVARAIHAMVAQDRASRREPPGPFIVVQVAGLPRDMVASVLFGHEKGAFSDAKSRRVGLLEEANGGTVLIDEVGDLPHEAQLQLLRFLQSYRLRRLGGNEEIPLDLRIIAATWHDLDEDVKKSTFRQDLLHRLRVGSLLLPPLRERKRFAWDIVPRVLEKRGHKARPLLTASVQDALDRQPWSGNLRELVGVLEEALALAQGETLRLEHLPPRIQRDYLRVPLQKRAPAFLVDEADDQLLTPEHARFRVRQLARVLEESPLPKANASLSNTGEFLKLLGGASDANQQARADIEALLKADQELRKQKGLADYWRKLAGLPLPDSVKLPLQQEEQAARERMEQLTARMTALSASSHISQNPWLNLLKEVQGLPLFAQAEPGEVSKFLVWVVNTLGLIAPSLVEQAQEALAQGGLTEVRRRLAKALKQAQEGEADDEAEEIDAEAIPARRQPGRLTREDWLTVAACDTQAEASALTGFDPKTIKKYLKQHGIEAPWARPDASGHALAPSKRTER